MKKADLHTSFDSIFIIQCDNICSQRKSYSVSEYERGDIMTPIGISRKVDSLGRIVLPKEIRRFFNINENEDVEILTTTDGILIKKPNYEVKKIERED